MNFSSDIKLAMRDCILKIFWPKDDIIQFFIDSGCSKSEVIALGDKNEKSRAAIVDFLFNILSKRSDEGLGQFRSILQKLINWSHFDSYWFDTKKKLNKDDAVRALTHLKQLQELRDAKIKDDRLMREKNQARHQQPSTTLESLKEEYLSLIQNTCKPQERGYKLEKILLELAKLSSLEVTEPFRIVGEQIDGAVKFEGEHYLIEAKWHDKALSNEPVYQFCHKINGKLYGRGVFVSINGFTSEVLQAVTYAKAINTVFADGADILFVLEGFYTFSQLLDKKIKAAQTKGLIYVDARNGASK